MFYNEIISLISGILSKDYYDWETDSFSTSNFKFHLIELNLLHGNESFYIHYYVIHYYVMNVEG